MSKWLLMGVLVAACGGETEPGPCEKALTECLDACPVDVGPPTAARSICVDACNADHAACEVPPPVEQESTCVVVAGGTYECEGVPIEHGHR